MNSYKFINPKQFMLSYGVHEGGYYIEPGETIYTWMPDAHGYDSKYNKVAGSPNPLIGPFLIKGAKPGNTLVINIYSLKPNRESGFASKDFHPNIHNPPLPLSTRRKDYVLWNIDLLGKNLKPDKKYFPNYEINIPIHSVLGCIGLASKRGVFYPSIECGMFGGNMDYPRLTNGTTIYLPIMVEDAFLYLGDGHALQGAGEITGNGIEVSCDIEFSIQIKKFYLNYPAGEDSEYLFTICNNKPLEKAFRIATSEMIKWLTTLYPLNKNQIGILMGQLVNYEIGNLVSKKYTVACCFPKSTLLKIK